MRQDMIWIQLRRPFRTCRASTKRIVIALGILLLVGSGQSQPGEVGISDARLDRPVSAASAFWGERYAYVLGGAADSSHLSDRILRFDPSLDAAVVLPERLPSARYGMASVWTGESAYFFGGHDGKVLDEIVRYTPSEQSITSMRARLPDPLHWATAAWDGRFAYIVGGMDANGASINTIVRYDPIADEVEVMQAKLPSPRHTPAVVWADGHLHILGGVRTPGQIYTDQIVQYDPTSDTISITSARLPTARDLMATTWDGERIFLLGGRDSGGTIDQILAYSPETGTTQILNQILPGKATEAMGTAYDGRTIYLFGGETHWAGTRSDAILRYDLPRNDQSAPAADVQAPAPTVPPRDSRPQSAHSSPAAAPPVQGEGNRDGALRVEVPGVGLLAAAAIAGMTVFVRPRNGER